MYNSKPVTMTWFERFLDIRRSALTNGFIVVGACPAWVFIWEWRLSVECSYFGFVEHSENCCAVSPVYCYQQVLVLADISHCFHVASPCKGIIVITCMTRRQLFLSWRHFSCKSQAIILYRLLSIYLRYCTTLEYAWIPRPTFLETYWRGEMLQI